jgi:hypothetical protein
MAVMGSGVGDKDTVAIKITPQHALGCKARAYKALWWFREGRGFERLGRAARLVLL